MTVQLMNAGSTFETGAKFSKLSYDIFQRSSYWAPESIKIWQIRRWQLQCYGHMFIHKQGRLCKLNNYNAINHYNYFSFSEMVTIIDDITNTLQHLIKHYKTQTNMATAIISLAVKYKKNQQNIQQNGGTNNYVFNFYI